MNTPETINIEKYAEALNNLVGMDIGYLGDSDENVNAIVELIVAAKKLETASKEWESKYFQQVAEVQGMREMVREIFAEIDRLIEMTAFADCWSEGGFRQDFAELKNKYTEGGV